MNVLIDHHIFTFQAIGGISRYFAKLVEYSALDEDLEYTLGLSYTKNEYIPQYHSKLYNLLNSRFPKFGNSLQKRLNRRKSINLLQNGDYDIFHPTGVNSYFFPYLKSTPLVITIHDLIYEKLPFLASPKVKFAKEEQRIIAQKAQHIIAISNSTKNDIIEFYDIAPEKISVVYHGYTKVANTVNEMVNITLPRRYLLFVGSRHTYKNFMLFLHAYKCLIDEYSDLYLICVGGGEFTQEEKEYITTHFLNSKVILYPFVADGILGELYRNALLFIFPSLYEGFGLPLLEAASYDCLMAISDIPVFREVMGNGAAYFSPNSIDSIYTVILECLNDEALCTTIRENATRRYQKFTWDATFEKTKEVYLKVLA